MTQPVPDNKQQPSKFSNLLSDKDNSPLARLPRARRVPSPQLPASSPPQAESRSQGFKLAPAFWTVTGMLSLLVNGVLIAILLIALQMFGQLRMATDDQVSGVLGGLYYNFLKMDNAVIESEIPVQDKILVDFPLTIDQTTNVILSEDVTINNARVTVQTGGLNITNAITTIVLPKDTRLPIKLNVAVQVTQEVPIDLKVKATIPLNQTGLHEPFLGLQEVVRPYYCMVEPSAQVKIGEKNLDVCK